MTVSTRRALIAVVSTGLAIAIPDRPVRSASPAEADKATAVVSPQAATARIAEAYGRLPLAFERNAGQSDPRVQFLARGHGYMLFLNRGGEAVLALRADASAPLRDPIPPDVARVELEAAQPSKESSSAILTLRLAGANQRADASGASGLPGKVNYFRGADRAAWRTGIATFSRVEYRDVYPGIDVVYYGQQRELEYDFVVHPGADPRAIVLEFGGADRLQVTESGDLVATLGTRTIVQRTPVLYQEVDGVRQSVRGRYTLTGRTRAAFEVDAYDRARTLVIDPVLVYSTYLGGASEDYGFGIAVDSAGSAYVNGVTFSSDFPTTPGSFATTFGGPADAFVTKLAANGAALVYSTYLGGSNYDRGSGIAVDSAGSAYVTGWSNSIDFPTTSGAFDTTYNGGFDAFVTKLDAAGSALMYSTYLGGSLGDIGDLGEGIAVDVSGNAYVTGMTNASDFPSTPGAFDTTFGGGTDAFVTKLNASGAALAYSTYLGNLGSDQGLAIAVDSAGRAYVTGLSAPGFPTTPGAFDTSFGGGPSDGFVTKLLASGAALAYSTYLGGSGEDYGSGIALDSGDNAHVTGSTASGGFPTTPGAFDTTFGGASDAFVTKLLASGAALAYSTYLGGTTTDYGNGIAVDSVGGAYVAGYTESSNFPTTPGALDTTFGGGSDAFVTSLDASGAALIHSTYGGGTRTDYGNAIAVDSAGSAYVTGVTFFSDFPTTPGAFDTTFGGVSDAFVVKIGEAVPVQPDLVETALSNPPAVVVLKQKFSVTDSAHNQGSEAGATTTRYYFSLDTVRSSGDKLLSGKRAVGVLAAGATSTGSAGVTVPVSIKVGVYYLLACADDLNVVDESDEGNNCRASTTTVNVRAPDLIETAVSNPPATASRGGSFSVTDTVNNGGNASAGLSTTRYYFSLDTKKAASDPLLTGTRAVPMLGVGANSMDTVSVTIPTTVSPATYYLLACADDLKKVAESNEKNNCKASATQVTVNP